MVESTTKLTALFLADRTAELAVSQGTLTFLKEDAKVASLRVKQADQTGDDLALQMSKLSLSDKADLDMRPLSADLAE